MSQSFHIILNKNKEIEGIYVYSFGYPQVFAEVPSPRTAELKLLQNTDHVRE